MPERTGTTCNGDPPIDGDEVNGPPTSQTARPGCLIDITNPLPVVLGSVPKRLP